MTAKIYKFPKGTGKQAGPEKQAKVEKPRALARPPRVLLITGQQEARELLSEALGKFGCDVTDYPFDARYYPAILLDLFEKNFFDVVIPTNLGIPFVYLPDLVALTRKFGKGAGIAVISGWVQDDFIAELARIPRTVFLQAPVQLEELLARVRELAETSAGRKERLPRLNVLLGDAKDNLVSQCLLDWLVARYAGLRDVCGAVQNSAEAILRVAANKPMHLFVLNLTPLWSPGKPFRDHIEFAGHLKKRFGRPVVMISGFEKTDLNGCIDAAGVDAYFQHPLDFEQIGVVMDELLNVK